MAGKGKKPEGGRNLENWDDGYDEIDFSIKRSKQNTEKTRHLRGQKTKLNPKYKGN